jgi:hypothetical protein
MVHDYIKRLPSQQSARKVNIATPITDSEVKRMRRQLDGIGALSLLNNGLKPGASAPPEVK